LDKAKEEKIEDDNQLSAAINLMKAIKVLNRKMTKYRNIVIAVSYLF